MEALLECFRQRYAQEEEMFGAFRSSVARLADALGHADSCEGVIDSDGEGSVAQVAQVAEEEAEELLRVLLDPLVDLQLFDEVAWVTCGDVSRG